MKTIEQISFDRYISDQSLPIRKRMDISCCLDWAVLGAREAQKWISVLTETPPIDEKVLVLCSSGKWTTATYRMYANAKTEWTGSSTFGKSITHWRPIERL